MNRFLTHIRKLNVEDTSLERQYGPLRGLGEKFAVLLIQLPPQLRFTRERAEGFFRKIARRRRRHAIEPRHETWLTDEALALLRRRGIALCIPDAPKYPARLAVTAPLVYLRFHGRERLYASDYDDATLRSWAERIRAWRAQGLDVYAYFNNDARAYAVRNALRLRELCG